MAEAPVLRLLRFRPSGSGVAFDAILRESLIPRLLESPGLRGAYAGRHGPDEAGERLIVSIWASDVALPSDRSEPFVFERHADIMDPAVEVLPLVVELCGGDDAPAHVLRAFRGRVREGELDAYVEEARVGTLADIAAAHGPKVLLLGTDPPDRFVTVSLWSSWERIELATGGNIRHPIATRNRERLVAGTASHYEVIPDAVVVLPPKPAFD